MSNAIQTYKDLLVWQSARILAKDVYSLCTFLPKSEVYGLSSQLKRSVVSIPSNIAEGYRRNSRKEYIQFLGIALGSAAEAETQLILVDDLFGIDTTACQKQTVEIQLMLSSLLKKLSA